MNTISKTISVRGIGFLLYRTRLKAVVAAKSLRAVAFAVELVTASILSASMGGKKTVEATTDQHCYATIV